MSAASAELLGHLDTELTRIGDEMVALQRLHRIVQTARDELAGLDPIAIGSPPVAQVEALPVLPDRKRTTKSPKSNSRKGQPRSAGRDDLIVSTVSASGQLSMAAICRATGLPKGSSATLIRLVNAGRLTRTVTGDYMVPNAPAREPQPVRTTEAPVTYSVDLDALGPITRTEVNETAGRARAGR